MLIEELDIFIPNGFELLRATAPYESDEAFVTSTGYGEVPVNTTDAFPPSEIILSVSVTVPYIVGLNRTVICMLSLPIMLTGVVCTKLKYDVPILIALIDIGLIELSFTVKTSDDESPLTVLG